MGKHKNAEQDAIIIQFMEAHKDIARGFVKGDKVKSDALWKQFAAELNKHGPPEKDISGWKKVWMDWKSFIRKKFAHNNSEARATGGGPFNKHTLTATEDKIAQLCGIFTVVGGIEKTADFGAPQNSEEMTGNSSEDEDAELPCRSSAVLSTPSRRRQIGLSDCLKANVNEQTVAMKTLAHGLEENVDATREVSAGLKSVCDAVKELTIAVKESTAENMRHHLQLERLRKEENEMKMKELELQELKMCSKYN
ncbi:uncharacterized protein LOC126764899 [Bactrocera neohumeralis]|uniref:uncharacterized protein LOC126764899 n=1 Tax=Bactrocera neohumeralis TaxID=98809 RepID=UPI002166271B|nr:uncharacterized protein LOC126764899 [Bactrocera neohumeralis]